MLEGGSEEYPENAASAVGLECVEVGRWGLSFGLQSGMEPMRHTLSFLRILPIASQIRFKEELCSSKACPNEPEDLAHYN